jgi:hypothetical protein
MNFWLRNKDKVNIFNSSFLVILLTLVYFSHILVFSLGVIVFFVYILLRYLGDIFLKQFQFRSAITQSGILIIGFIPGILLSLKYLMVRGTPSSSDRLGSKELLEWIIDIRAAINYNYVLEAKYLNILSLLMFLILLVSGMQYFWKRMMGSHSDRIFRYDSYIWLIISLIILTLYFLFPNQSSGGSYISLRLNLLFFIFFILWLITLKLPSWLKKTSLVIIIIVNFVLVNHHSRYIKNYSTYVQEFVKMSEHIEENSIILPVRNSGKWLDLHFSNYMGINKPQVILENYEACTGYFPLEWNTTDMPMVILADTVRTDLCLYNKFPLNRPDSVLVDYVIMWGEKPLEGCKNKISALISQTYDTVCYSKEKNITLFKLRKSGK